MTVSLAIKSGLATFLYSSRIIASKLRSSAKSGFALLMYHRIIPKGKFDGQAQAGMYVTPETFAMHLSFLAKHFKLIPLSDLIFFLKNPRNAVSGKPMCALTFDDGWSDFYTYAYPIIKANQAPATVFLPTDFIGTKNWFWTDRLAHLLIQKDRLTLLRSRASSHSPSHKPYHAGLLDKLQGSSESKIEEAIALLKAFRNEDIEEILDEYADRWKLDAGLSGRAFLNWDEVAEMARSGLISFGSHTAGHRILTTLGDEEVMAELVKSKEQLIAMGVVHPFRISFSYPNGCYSPKIVEMVREAGYAAAVITQRGWNSFTPDSYRLQRIGIHQDVASSEAMMAYRAANIF
jgi:peptidoglycan/xylan/chitin deacetylase (PgdA/CDA1 family)